MAINVERRVNGFLVNTNTTPTPSADAVAVADGAGKLVAGWGGGPSTLATLDGSGNVVEDPANPSFARWTKYTIAATDFTAAAATEDIEIFTLPIRGTIHRVVLKHSVAFSGGSLASMTVSVGVTGSLSKYAVPFDVFQAPSDTTFGFNNLPGMENFGATFSVRAEAIAGGDTLDNVSTGSLDIWFLTSELPA